MLSCVFGYLRDWNREKKSTDVTMCTGYFHKCHLIRKLHILFIKFQVNDSNKPKTFSAEFFLVARNARTLYIYILLRDLVCEQTNLLHLSVLNLLINLWYFAWYLFFVGFKCSFQNIAYRLIIGVNYRRLHKISAQFYKSN